MLIGIAVSLLIASALAALFMLLRSFLFTPVPVSENLELELVLTVSGSAPGLEGTVNSLLWLRQSGALWGEIKLVDMGMDAQTLETALILQRKGVINLECTGGQDERK